MQIALALVLTIVSTCALDLGYLLQHQAGVLIRVNVVRVDLRSASEGFERFGRPMRRHQRHAVIQEIRRIFLLIRHRLLVVLQRLIDPSVS